MKNKLSLLVLLLVITLSNAQVTVSADILGNFSKFSPELFKKFKSTTTIFILSNQFKKEEYERILKESWTVTPFKVLSIEEFDYNNFLSESYSFAHLRAFSQDGSSTFFVNNIINFYLLDVKKINEKVAKVKVDPKKFIKLIITNKLNIGAIHLFANTEFLASINKTFGSGGGVKLMAGSSDFSTDQIKNPKISKSDEEMIRKVYNDNIYKNYSLGMLKNYFQNVNDLIEKESYFDLKEVSKSPELKNLKKEILYVPDYNKVTYKPSKFVDEAISEKGLSGLFQDYKGKYEFISSSALDAKILSGEPIYYLRYVRVNSRKYFQVVNAKSGEAIYKEFAAGMGTYNIESQDFKDLYKNISN